jgi:hypothetical protein
MYQMMNHSENMRPAAQAEGMFSCALIAILMDTISMVSILISLIRILALRLRGLLILGNKSKGAIPAFG